MAKRHHEWFVWPKDSQTNEAVARFLQDGDNRFEGLTLTDALCADGKRRNLWRCTETQAYFLWRSENLKIAVFNRTGNSKPRDVTILFRKDRRSPKKKKRKTSVAVKGKI
ncbi:MAG: hypothetical protein ABIJ84_01855 [bacterium]